ncbi:eukaryotic translation initiation factor 1A-like [Equus asinus]|uniref:eukaryotic translation initiation factor 1A-like n=1 Tax=Equus asinus TaxID=9793 RepID=UPI00071A9B80
MSKNKGKRGKLDAEVRMRIHLKKRELALKEDGQEYAQDNKAGVILKPNQDEAISVKAYGELPEHAKFKETDTFGPGDDDGIQFDDIGNDEEDIDDI